MLIDLLQSINLQRHKESIQKLRREMSTDRCIDLRQDERIALLERQHDNLALCLCGLAKLLTTKGSVTQEEFAQLVEEVEKTAGGRPQEPQTDPTSDGITPEMIGEAPAPRTTCPACQAAVQCDAQACPACGIALA